MHVLIPIAKAQLSGSGNAMFLFSFSVLDEPSSHTYDARGEKVEMQQFDKHGYYFCNLLCCMYDEFTATVRISAMLMKRDQAPRYIEMSLQRSSEPSWSSHAFLTLNIISVNLALTVSSLNGAFNKILR